MGGGGVCDLCGGEIVKTGALRLEAQGKQGAALQSRPGVEVANKKGGEK